METEALTKGRAAAERLLAGDVTRRKGEAEVIAALCDLAVVYRLGEAELTEVLLERRVRVGGEGTPTVSEHLRLEIAGLLRCTPAAAAGRLADALNLKHRHPRLYAAVQGLEVDGQRALKAASRCAELHPAMADEVTARWVRRQRGLGWTAAFTLLDKLIIQADEALAAAKERRARESRGVWTWGLFEGVMNLTGRLDVFDAQLLDRRLDEVATLLEDGFPTLSHGQLRAKALTVLVDPVEALRLLDGAAQPTLPAAQRCQCDAHRPTSRTHHSSTDGRDTPFGRSRDSSSTQQDGPSPVPEAPGSRNAAHPPGHSGARPNREDGVGFAGLLGGGTPDVIRPVTALPRPVSSHHPGAQGTEDRHAPTAAHRNCRAPNDGDPSSAFSRPQLSQCLARDHTGPRPFLGQPGGHGRTDAAPLAPASVGPPMDDSGETFPEGPPLSHLGADFACIPASSSHSDGRRVETSHGAGAALSPGGGNGDDGRQGLRGPAGDPGLATPEARLLGAPTTSHPGTSAPTRGLETGGLANDQRQGPTDKAAPTASTDQTASPDPAATSGRTDVGHGAAPRRRHVIHLSVHIHSDAVGALDGAARIEAAGHITTQMLGQLLGEGRFDVRVQPVIDLPMQAPSDRYVPTPRMRRAVALTFPTEPFPFSSRDARGLDIDHTVAFRSGQVGQTRIGNLAPLTRGVHRAKTAGFWSVQQPAPGLVHWSSPLGYRYEVTADGTTTLSHGEGSR